MSTAVSAIEAVQQKVDEQGNRWTSGPAIVLYLAAFKLIFQLLCASRYGFMNDELYFVSCSEHLGWGYVDHPPLVALLMFLARHLFGDSLVGIRLLPALLGAALVWVVGATARELGGGRFAQGLAAIAVLAVPEYLFLHHYFSMNSVEPLIWAGCTYFAIASVRREDPRYWIGIGTLWGVGLENKYSTAVFVIAVLLGLLLTPARRFLMKREFWIGSLFGLLIFVPNLIWLIRHDFPFIRWQQGIAARGYLLKPALLESISQQLLMTGLTCIVWLAGVWFFFFHDKGKPYRFVGWAFVIMLGFLFAMRAKAFYAAPLYATVFSGGAVWIEELTAAGWRRFRPVIVLLIVAVAGTLAPCFVPILPIDRVVSYERKLGLPLPIRTERFMAESELPSWFVTETGWDGLVASVARVYNSLPPEERSRTGILTYNYASAGAVDFLGSKYGLPKAISTHLSFHMWGPRNYTGDTLIFVGYLIPPEACEQFVPGARIDNPYMYSAYGLNGPSVNVCRGLRANLQKVWPLLPYY